MNSDEADQVRNTVGFSDQLNIALRLNELKR